MNNKIPPPLVAIIAIVLMFIIDEFIPATAFQMPYGLIVCIVLLSLSLSIIVAGWWEFRRVKTTVNPLKPEKASELVRRGIFSYTRNPMYLGMLGFLSGVFFYFANALTIVPIILFFAFIHHYQITPEEKAMQKLFPSEFDDYCSQVRRWL